MNLETYRANVSKHLDLIEAGSEMAARHARALPIKPAFETFAENELAKTRKVLEAALANVIAAQTIYEAKPVEKSHAA